MADRIEKMNFEDIVEDNSSFTDKFLLFLFPHLELQSTKYELLWQQISQKNYKKRALIVTGLVAVMTLVQLFLDSKLGLQPEREFFKARLICIFLSLSIAVMILSFKSLNIRRYKVLLVVLLTAIAVEQVELTILEPKVPFVFAFGILTIGVFALDLSVGASIIYLGGFFLADYSRLAQILPKGIDPVAQMLSIFLLASAFILMSKGHIQSEIRNFILNQKMMEEKEKNIQNQKDLSDQTKAFLPSEIYRRIINTHTNKKLSVVEATDEVLRLRQKKICCLFTDIRDFTDSSKDLEKYLRDVAIPNIKIMTHQADERGGVTRVIGDLILSYFDFSSISDNLTKSFSSALAICIQNSSFNKSVASGKKVNRFVILSVGEAMVGNIGSLEHSREITALGPCVNLTERIDRLTKEKSFQKIVPFNSIVMTTEYAEQLEKHIENIPFKTLEIESIGLSVKNFDNISQLVYVDVVNWFEGSEHQVRKVV